MFHFLNVFIIGLEKGVVIVFIILQKCEKVQTANIVVIVEIINLKCYFPESVFFVIYEIFHFVVKWIVLIIRTEVKILSYNFGNVAFIPSGEVR